MTLTGYVRKTLTELVRIPSTPDTDMSEILKAATQAIEALGLRAEVHADVKAVLASSGKGGVLFNGHLDTVPVASGWTREQGSWDADFLYARGTTDMKAGCLAALAAARELLAKRVSLHEVARAAEILEAYATRLAPASRAKART